ncbi:transmembrane 220 family protein [Tellurirhabdus rosea]|uniref:transmembrane 220 family protein n=1 Tax=Tellurirhabdus rosea TaxID=2674997 RepID=UPI0022549BE4|nr:transmembrane 220 family protein [Tellurirhabdus rosea]
MNKIIAVIFGILFLISAALQYNDPDPEVWVPIYLFGVVACVLGYLRIGKPWFFAGMAVIYLVAAYFQWPPAFEGFLLNEMGMKTLNVELARESGGLAISGIGMLLLAWAVSRKAVA